MIKVKLEAIDVNTGRRIFCSLHSQGELHTYGSDSTLWYSLPEVITHKQQQQQQLLEKHKII